MPVYLKKDSQKVFTNFQLQYSKILSSNNSKFLKTVQPSITASLLYRQEYAKK